MNFRNFKMPLPHVEWKNRVIIKQLKDYFKTHSEIREYQAHSAKVHSVSWNADGNYLASGSFDKLVAIFALNQDKLVIHLMNCSYIILVL